MGQSAQEILKPSTRLLCKLGSIAVHTDEMLSPHGHAFDRTALEALLQDEEVTNWLAGMGKLALIPKKREGFEQLSAKVNKQAKKRAKGGGDA